MLHSCILYSSLWIHIPSEEVIGDYAGLEGSNYLLRRYVDPYGFSLHAGMHEANRDANEYKGAFRMPMMVGGFWTHVLSVVWDEQFSDCEERRVLTKGNKTSGLHK